MSSSDFISPPDEAPRISTKLGDLPKILEALRRVREDHEDAQSDEAAPEEKPPCP